MLGAAAVVVLYVLVAVGEGDALGGAHAAQGAHLQHHDGCSLYPYRTSCSGN